MKATKCVVITGSIGCGKSSVCKILSQKGYEVIDADKIARELFETSKEEIKNIFGDEAANDRKILAGIVFEDEVKRKQLEQIMHPKIKEEIFAKIGELEKKGKIYFIFSYFHFPNFLQLQYTPILFLLTFQEDLLTLYLQYAYLFCNMKFHSTVRY